jgi:hypothetical protein
MAREEKHRDENEEPRRSANGDATAANAWNSERPRSERTAMLICIFGVLAYSVVMQMMSASTQVRSGVVAFMIYFPCFRPHSTANMMRLCAIEQCINAVVPAHAHISLFFLCSADEWSL